MHNFKTPIFLILVSLFLVISGIKMNAKDYKVTEIASNMEFPWSLAFLPNNDMLVTERTGHLRLIKNGQLKYQINHLDPVQRYRVNLIFHHQLTDHF